MAFWKRKKPIDDWNLGGSAKRGDVEGKGKITLGRRERRLLSETIHIEEELVPHFVKPALTITGTLVIVFLVWSAMTKMKEVARAPGEIIPSGKVKLVQHLDGGMIAEIGVEERKLVQQGQVLLKIDGAQALADLRQMEARRDSLRLRGERLKAFAEGRKPNFAALGVDQSVLVANQTSLYATQVATRSSSLSILGDQINQRKQRIQQLEQALAAARQHEKLTSELETMREDLASRKLVNRSVLLETRRTRVTASGEVARLSEEIALAKQELAEVRSRYADTQNQSQRDALSELGSVGSELAEVEETIRRLRARVERLEVRSPIQGYVQDLKVITVGQVIQPGALLMQIVPDNAPLEAEVRIQPRDIGFVREGQAVNLRITTYDYSRFGLARGVLRRVSATNVIGEDNKPYYRGLVEISHPWVGDVPGRNPLRTGMGVEAEILTGEKTLLAYLVKPLVDVVSMSFHER